MADHAVRTLVLQHQVNADIANIVAEKDPLEIIRGVAVELKLGGRFEYGYSLALPWSCVSTLSSFVQLMSVVST